MGTVNSGTINSEKPHLVQRKETFPAQLTSRFSLQTDWHQWEEINQTAMPKLFCPAHPSTVAWKETLAQRHRVQKGWPFFLRATSEAHCLGHRLSSCPHTKVRKHSGPPQHTTVACTPCRGVLRLLGMPRAQSTLPKLPAPIQQGWTGFPEEMTDESLLLKGADTH